MSQKHRPTDGGGTSERGQSRSRAVDCETVLTALEDPDCRALLEATADEALTAGELIERCGVPRSTTYRKLDRLTEAGLLAESIRISPDGKHANEYRRTFDDVTISLDDCESTTVGLSSTGASTGAAD
ncbi:MAG: DNA-binding transcriptional ArsR family regulator [Natronomonas sp.]|jgi:DNA-binding transcriptional ArsR family regulator|uniref:helix-turn-helix domain-containing protein n=1 Tax=Natronomonas sp. TaxID=2184060 RepID=UPI0039893F6F